MKRATADNQVARIYSTISIHALVKRATGFGAYADDYIIISIHALVKRATFTVTYSVQAFVNFNPRPREEGDFLLIRLICFMLLFQSTPS